MIARDAPLEEITGRTWCTLWKHNGYGLGFCGLVRSYDDRGGTERHGRRPKPYPSLHQGHRMAVCIGPKADHAAACHVPQRTCYRHMIFSRIRSGSRTEAVAEPYGFPRLGRQPILAQCRRQDAGLVSPLLPEPRSRHRGDPRLEMGTHLGGIALNASWRVKRANDCVQAPTRDSHT